MVEIVVICDRSFSMIEQDKWPNAVKGFRSLVEEQRTVPGDACMTLVVFNHEYEVPFERKPLADVDPDALKAYEPAGNTALFDAIGRTLDKQLAAKGIVAIITDGEENSSNEYKNREDIRTLIKRVEDGGWEVHYLAAGAEAFAEHQRVGIPTAHAAKFANSGVGLSESYMNASIRSTNYRMRVKEEDGTS